MKKLTIYLSLLLILASACKKYEEGPLISLRSKEKRLCQTWNLEEVTKDGEAISHSDVSYQWVFHKNGDLTYTVIDNGVPWTPAVSQWKWTDNKESIEILWTYLEGEEWRIHRIKRLKYEELILERTSEEGALYRYVCKPK